MPKEICIFCNVALEASKKCLPASATEEHVFAKWVRKPSVNKNMRMFTATGNAEPQLVRKPPLERLVNKKVCRSCNGGWMSHLETEVAPIFDKMNESNGINSLGSGEVETLARWTAKTAAVLSHVTPQLQFVPRSASASLHPTSKCAPKFRFFYAHIDNNLTLENGYLQIVYGAEIGLIGTTEPAGTRIILCIQNHCLIVDFPPMLEGVIYDLNSSPCSMVWPIFEPAGISQLIPNDHQVHLVLKQLCRSIEVAYDPRALVSN